MVENPQWDLAVSVALQSPSKVYQQGVAYPPLMGHSTTTFIWSLILWDIPENWNLVLSFCVSFNDMITDLGWNHQHGKMRGAGPHVPLRNTCFNKHDGWE